MKSKALIPLILGGVVGLLAIKLGVDTIQRAQGTPTETVKTVVARVDIPASYEITADMIDVVTTPRSPLVPEGAFQTVEDLNGRVSSKAIPQGAVISPMSLAPPGTPAGLTERIPEGHRAVSVKVDEVSGVAGQLKPGDFVDVIVVMRVKRGRQDETISRIILQRVTVLAVGRSLGGEADAGPQKMARSVTLLVANRDVPKLHLAQTQGTVTLAMRGASDRLTAEDSYVSTAEWETNPLEEMAAEEPSETGPSLPTLLSGLWAGNAVAQANVPGNPEVADVVEEKPFMVTVVNGPLRAQGATTVQRVTYETRESLKVVDVSSGRAGEGFVGSPDSAEGIMRKPAPTAAEMAAMRLNQNYGGPGEWAADFAEPQDREIAGE